MSLSKFALFAPSVAALVLGLAATAPAVAAPLVLGSPATGEICAPIICTLRYQQVLSASLFSGPISINEITVYDLRTPGVLPANDFTIRLSTARRGVGAITQDFAGNIGADVQTFFSGSIPGGAAPSFDIFGMTFNYNPGAGDLLLDITRNTPTANVTNLYLDGSNGQFAGSDYVFTYNYEFFTGVARASGLTLGFNTGAAGGGGAGSAAVPEPAAWAMMILGLGGVGATLRRRRSACATRAWR